MKAIDKAKEQLLLQKGWRYLRYLHLREAVHMLKDCNSVVTVGGNGLAEFALAAEFPDRKFHALATPPLAGTFQMAQELQKQYSVKNLTYGTYDIARPGRPPRSFDLAAAIHVLEYQNDDAAVAKNIVAMGSKAAFCLAPFAEESIRNDRKLVAETRIRSKQNTPGYSVKRLAELFDGLQVIRGCYWVKHGMKLRDRLEQMDEKTIRAQAGPLATEAKSDLLGVIPVRQKQGLGIWIIVR